ncbi:hypothetical protein Tcan_05958 [Toxocara canis]|uniref:Serum response factor-binding protein 1 n=1 Tax=Toxocara canis TaxID=6265 RepID=A0A0B2VD00_TOXCA|nr:hypothetical protein Tcan_05958 [Toxocara canis]
MYSHNIERSKSKSPECELLDEKTAIQEKGAPKFQESGHPQFCFREQTALPSPLYSVFDGVTSEMTYTHESMPGAQYYDGKKINIPITHEAGAELLDRWVTQCISSIMSSIASERSEQLNEFHRNRLFKCSNRAENVHEQARCVVDALDAQINKSIASNLRARRMKKLNELKKLNKGNVIGSFLRNYSGWRGELEERMDLTKPKYRKKRAIVRKTKYSLLSESGGLTPFGIIGKHFARIVTTLKKKAINQSWATITSEVENMQRKFHDKNTFEETLRKNFATLGHLSMSRPFSKRNKSKGSANMTEKMGRKAVSETNRLLHSAIQLAMILSKQNSTAIQQKTLKVASPRLLSIVPEDVQNTLSLFSPSLFSLHEHGNATEALFSLPSIIRALDNKDYEQWMNFVLEASGVSDVINFIKESGLNEIRLDLDSMPRGIDNQPLYFTKENLTEMGGEYERRKADIFESLSRALTRKQGSANMTEKMGRKAVSETNRLLHSAIQLAMILSKQNSTAIQQKTLKVASPRLLSIVPEDVQNTLSLFSPSLFSLHEHGNATEALFSLPSIIRALDNKDYEQWMNFVLEASGVSDVINFIKESGLNEIRLDLDSMPRGIDNQPLYFTKENLTEMGGEYERRKADIFESLSRALTKKQSADFKRRGFSVLTKDQLELVYGADSPYNDTKSLARFVSLTEADVHRHLMSSVRYLAKMDHKITSRRHKRFVLSPLLFAVTINQIFPPLILSPVLLSVAIFSPSILGPVILSPWLFNPTIFSAHIIAPIILSPIAFSPYVLSPILLRPVVLAPQVLNPYILSPNVLSPYILSPTVLSPSILSPYALSPNVWQPTALRAIVLSPFVLSPSFCSPTFFVLTLLSPSALSPSINSTGTASASILSPSAFS